MLVASFKSWARPAHSIRADSRNTGGPANGSTVVYRSGAGLSDLTCLPTNTIRERYVRKSGYGAFADWVEAEYSISPHRISEEFQQLYRPCLSEKLCGGMDNVLSAAPCAQQ